MESRFEINTQFVGPAGVLSRKGSAATGLGPDGFQDETECLILNRVVRWTESGWDIEPDQIHVDLLAPEFQLVGANNVITPGGMSFEQEKEITNMSWGRGMRHGTEPSRPVPIIWQRTGQTSWALSRSCAVAWPSRQRPTGTSSNAFGAIWWTKGVPCLGTTGKATSSR